MISAAPRLRARILTWVLLAAVMLLPRAGFAVSAPDITTQPLSQSVRVGSNAVFTVVASGEAPLGYRWSFNGTNLTDGAHIGGAASARLTITNVIAADAGDYRVVVKNHQGRATSSNATLTVLFTNHYVNLNNSHPMPPYADWATAATNIQDAIDVANPGNRIFVTNGLYRFGNCVTSVTTNCVAAVIPVSIIGVSGAAQTIIDGGGLKCCVYLTNGAALSGFTLSNGTSPEKAAVFAANLPQHFLQTAF